MGWNQLQINRCLYFERVVAQPRWAHVPATAVFAVNLTVVFQQAQDAEKALQNDDEIEEVVATSWALLTPTTPRPRVW